LCSDFFLLANTEIYHVENFFSKGTHKITLNIPGEDAKVNI